MSQGVLRVSAQMLLQIPCHSALEAACKGTRWRHSFNTQVHQAGFTLLSVVAGKAWQQQDCSGQGAGQSL